ncbi:TetR/AcrR family transcriptional regulator [Sphingosinicella sp. LHD-64]|uniref:TetR/AcrR family transcriptional regulator n=1 Tax=Sphingosinicella sp. LHD-64 TaxID=3072139 RepID=UPI00280D9D3F|nr:TetR/AcrR family transcriptional regulator [Sphingosinicella sp. LHD-64]MDQ8758206.1 TetR/AcrR family transcriptional regulator [Sphingosinicella sp. LHD-64]
MDAAAALFIAKGVEATIVDEIVSAAGVSKGTFYHYFETKADIVTALRARFSDAFVASVEAAVQASPDNWDARMRAWVAGAVDAYLDNFQIHDVVFHDYGPYDRGSDEMNAILDRLGGLISGGIAAGAWAVDDVRLAAIMIFQGMHGAVDDCIARGSDRTGLADRVSAMVRRLLGPAHC